MRKVIAIEKSEIERLTLIHDRFRLLLEDYRNLGGKFLGDTFSLYSDLNYLGNFINEAEGNSFKIGKDFIL